MANIRRFDALAAIDDSADRKRSVTFGVYVLRDGQWTAAYTSDIVRGGDSPEAGIGGCRWRAGLNADGRLSPTAATSWIMRIGSMRGS